MVERRVTRIKICGITNVKDAEMVCECGADAIGFVFTPSPRYITPEKALIIHEYVPPFVTTVGIFTNIQLAVVQRIINITGIDVIQLHGDESPEYCYSIPRRVIKRIPVLNTDTSDILYARMKKYDTATMLLDPGGGDGKVFDWTIARGIERPLIIAGGLTPDNVHTVVRLLKPYGVDVSSGVEESPGIKNRKKVAAFIKEVRTCC
jgi:phosphoribosylanthranilate isomerase